MTDNPTRWTTCRIGSCRRHQDCMYTPCWDGEAPAYQPPDITDRLALYWRTYADLPSLALHPETPGYSHGMLIGDTRDARVEIERLRAENARLRAQVEALGKPQGRQDKPEGDSNG